MEYINRQIYSKINNAIARNKSVLLLGPRQTGKTTFLEHQIETDISLSFIEADVKRRYEKTPEILINEIRAFSTLHESNKKPIVLIDEIQKVPSIMDTIQYLIDKKLANFILTGSSARKLKHNKDLSDINLLPGRVIEFRMESLGLSEIPHKYFDINDLILNGSLPEIIQQETTQDKEELLNSYVNIYLEEEIRAEAIVRNLASFSRFLTYAAVEAGNGINVSKLSQEIGVSRYTIDEYFQILLDCLIVDRIEPITDVTTRRRLTKTPKYLFFDMGIRRIAAGEGLRLPKKYYGHLFEQFIGIEILKIIRLYASQAKLRYWHDHAGLEVDYVIEFNRQYIPIEVKWTSTPSVKDIRHLSKFMSEYECDKYGYVICQTPQPLMLEENILAISWKDIPKYIGEALNEGF